MNLINPYKGLFPYTSKDEHVFFGREKESSDLIEMIKNNKLVVLFGESGTGKTSLINAKLFPSLRNQYFFPIYIRINFSSTIPPISQVKEIIYQELHSWDETVPGFTSTTTLLEYAAKTCLFKGLVKPILFFDQFEELITIAPRHISQANIDELINQLAELIESNQLPARYIEKNEPEKQEFNMDQQHENMLRFKVVFSLRQDFIAQLDDLRFKIPSIITSKYRIKKFNYIQAYEAIVGPPLEITKNLEGWKKETPVISEEAAFQSIKELGKPTLTTTEDISLMNQNLLSVIKRFTFHEQKDMENLEFDPTIVSLYCYQLFEDAKKNNDEFTRITLEQVHNSPFDQIIKRYYDSSLVQKKLKYAIENFLITPDGRRLLMPIKEFAEKAKITVDEIDDLRQRTAILRIYGKDDDREVEIAHDQIAKRALVSKKEREANKIKRNAAVISFAALFVVTLAISFILYYVNQEKKKVDIIRLLRAEDSLKVQNDRLATDLNQANNNYNDINKEFSLFKTQNSSDFTRLENEINTANQDKIKLTESNKALLTQSQVLQNQYKTQLNVAENQRKIADQKTDELNKLISTNTRLQNEISNLQARYKNYNDTLDFYKRNLNTTNARIKVLETDNKRITAEINRLEKKYNIKSEALPSKTKN